MVLAGVAAALAVLLGAAVNAATGAERWPGPLDVVRERPWWSVAAIGSLTVLGAVAAAWIQERAPADGGDPPPPPPPVVPGWFVDRAQAREVVAAVCRDGQAVGITTSLYGAGGFGKTTLATAVAAHRRVRRHFRSRVYTVTIGRDVRGPAAVAAKVAEATRFITGDTTEFDDPELAGAHLGRLLDQRPRTLLVLDDVWETEQLAPFLHGGRRCVRLITTRNPGLLPTGTERIPVDEMTPEQARALLTLELASLPAEVVDGLLQATGRWALLLRLTNRQITEQVATGADPVVAAQRILDQLRAAGPAAVDEPASAWNLDDPRLRNQAVEASIQAAATLLPPGGADRFMELGIFAEDEPIPVSAVALLWRATSSLSEEQTRALCRGLERLSLISLDPRDGGRIRLHDIIRDYLRATLGRDRLARLNGQLVDTVAAQLPPAQPLASVVADPQRAWWELQDHYLLDHLIDHLLAAGRTRDAEGVAGDLRWVETRLTQRGPTAPWNDLDRIDTPYTRPLARSLTQAAHLLTPTTPPRALTTVLHQRLHNHPHWHPQIATRQHDPALRPCLINQWPPPDTPHPAVQRTFVGHAGPVFSVAVAPDGVWLATGSWDGTVRVWDRVTGACTATFTSARGVESVAVAPDGTWLASGGSDGVVRVWDRVTGACTATLTGHASAVSSVAVAPDGTWLASGGDGVVRVWDRVTGACTATLTSTRGEFSVAVAPDGAWLASGGSDGVVRVWDRVTGACTATLTGHGGGVLSVAVAPDGAWLATGGSDGVVRVWDRVTGACTATLTGHGGGVLSVAVAPDGAWLATGGSDGVVRVWDRVTGACTATLTGHASAVSSVAVAPDGAWLATGSSDGTVRVWDSRHVGQLPAPAGQAGSVFSVAVAPDGAWLASGGSDGVVRVWDRVTGACTATLTGHGGGVLSVGVASDGSWLATGSSDGVVRVWDRVTGACTATLTGHGGGVLSVVVAPDGAWLAAGGSDGVVRVWDRVTSTCTATLTGHASAVLSVAVAPDGAWLAAGGEDGMVRVWDRVTGACAATLTGHSDGVLSVGVASDGSWLATGSSDGRVRVWDRVTGACTATLAGHRGGVTSVAVAPVGSWLATTGSDGTVRIWDVMEWDTVAVARADGALHSCAWVGSTLDLMVGGERGVYLFSFLP
ncbi:NB-ARC domain-containing protein [Allostreptomyces psammosilenae]|uniref:WD40 repeat protein n=1 Tax=Allostreptomyces psammosilenae TaxID=1892865 RepID=A0A853A282_9ACTN|nr:NB-ARC domain-containing protein [Allostreptomyces psammosilenae]NYI07570.1 WD40 repeat protein [Allostreptomyces psammosilenae]